MLILHYSKTSRQVLTNSVILLTLPLGFIFAGFLYMSNFLHQWLTATQYVAPLMANFDTQVGNNSRIHYVDNGKLISLDSTPM